SSLLSSMHLSSSSKSKASPSLPSTATFGSPPSSSSPTPAPTAHSTAVLTFRQLVFGGAIPIHFEIATDELPPGADRSVESYYLQAPRITYLPLLLPQIQKYFLDLILDDSSAATIRTEDLWFSYEGVPLRWHWPIGLLYDYHTSHAASPPSSNPSSTLPSSLASVFAPSRSASPSPSALDQRTLRSTSSPYTSARGAGMGGAVGGPLPWKITLHVKQPPNEVLLMGSSVEACRGCFMNMVKEADYVRWGSVKRVTNLRKEQQDGLWEGVVGNDFDRFYSTFTKLVPLPSSSPSSSRSPTPIGGGGGGSSIPTDGRLPDANAVRSVPMRVYLPEGAPVLQEVVPPVVDGEFLSSWSFQGSALSCFPPRLSSRLCSPRDRPLTSVSLRCYHRPPANPLHLPLHLPPTLLPSFLPPLAVPIIHGIAVPLEAELGWLGAGMCGADGWVAVVLRLG
ncbi:autophagy protein Apg5-domain-containing protein, partial [Leucosporidium creatinivorum]